MAEKVSTMDTFPTVSCNCYHIGQFRMRCKHKVTVALVFTMCPDCKACSIRLLADLRIQLIKVHLMSITHISSICANYPWNSFLEPTPQEDLLLVLIPNWQSAMIHILPWQLRYSTCRYSYCISQSSICM